MLASLSRMRRPGLRLLCRQTLCSAAEREKAADSLVPDTLREMDAPDGDFAAAAKQLREVGRERLSIQERKRRRRALDSLGIESFASHLQSRGLDVPIKASPTTLQVNVGLYCNQACTHCHVESSPRRTETMSSETVAQILRVLDASPSVATVDITGGAPEMHDAFRPLVEGARARGLEVIDRCNLTVLAEPGYEDLPTYLASQGVRVVASLPCYSRKNVDTQRGNKVFERSIRGLRSLNGVGYGVAGSGLRLDLVYNPGGAFLPPPQDTLHAAYTRELKEAFGITFNELFTITNMPIKRFADLLYKQGKLTEYMQLLVDAFNPATLDALMCRTHVSIAHDGGMYDCDFNLALGSPIPAPGRTGGRTIHDITSLDEIHRSPPVTGSHCFACAAGNGSS